MSGTLDIGCGSRRQPNAFGMDKRALPGVDLVHDLEVLPWPLPDGKFNKIIACHVFEHLKPWLMFDIMDECWRVLESKGQIKIAMPCAGSYGLSQDPTHVRTWNEATPQHFDPDYKYYNYYQPKPWKILKNTWYNKGLPEGVTERVFNGSLYFVLEKRDEVTISSE